MSIRELTIYVVRCDWKDCSRDSSDLNFDRGGSLTQGEALTDWVNHDAVDCTNGKQYCDEHATSACIECGSLTEDLFEGKDRWFRCREHHELDGS